MRISNVLLAFLLTLSFQIAFSQIDTIQLFHHLNLKGIGSEKTSIIRIISDKGDINYTLENPYGNQIDVSNLPQGNYSVVVSEEGKVIHRRKIYILGLQP